MQSYDSRVSMVRTTGPRSQLYTEGVRSTLAQIDHGLVMSSRPAILCDADLSYQDRISSFVRRRTSATTSLDLAAFAFTDPWLELNKELPSSGDAAAVSNNLGLADLEASSEGYCRASFPRDASAVSRGGLP